MTNLGPQQGDKLPVVPRVDNADTGIEEPVDPKVRETTDDYKNRILQVLEDV